MRDPDPDRGQRIDALEAELHAIKRRLDELEPITITDGAKRTLDRVAPDTLGRRETLKLGLLAGAVVITGTGQVRAAESVDGAACSWLGDQNANGYGLFDLRSLEGPITGEVEITDLVGTGLSIDGGALTAAEPFAYDIGMTQWADGLSNEEINRIELEAGETLVVDRIEFQQKGGGSDASASIRVRDTSTAETIGSQTLGGVTTDPGESGAGNTVEIQITNSTGATINAAPRVTGRIEVS